MDSFLADFTDELTLLWHNWLGVRALRRLPRGQEAIPVETKKADRVTPADARHLRRTEEITGHRLHTGLVVHRGRRVLPLGERLWAVPDVLLFGERPQARPTFSLAVSCPSRCEPRVQSGSGGLAVLE